MLGGYEHSKGDLFLPVSSPGLDLRVEISFFFFFFEMQTLCPRSVYSAVFNWYHGNSRSAQGLGRHIRTFL